MQIIRDETDIADGLRALALADPLLVPVIDAAGKVPLRLAHPDFAGLASIMVVDPRAKVEIEVTAFVPAA